MGLMMAIVLPGKYCFFVHARTGSTSLTEGLAGVHDVLRTRYHHAKPQEQLKLCTGGEIKFAVVRNPFDIVASWFCLNKFKTISDLLDKFKHTWFRNNDGNLFTFFDPHVDEYLRYENLGTEVHQLMSHLKLPQPQLQCLNPTPNKQHYSSYYTSVEVSRMYAEFPEIEDLGYEFETPLSTEERIVLEWKV